MIRSSLFFLFLLGMLVGCSKKGQDEIVVIIEDATFKGPDTSRGPTGKLNTGEGRRVNLTGAVALLKADLDAADPKLLKRHAEALRRAVDQEILNSSEGERKRTLNLFSIKLLSLNRSLDEINTKVAFVREKPNLGRFLEELSSLARRIEGR